MDAAMMYATAAAIFTMLMGLSYLYGRSVGRHVKRAMEEADAAALGAVGLSPTTSPLRVRYTLDSKNGRAVRSGVVTFHVFTYGDFFRQSCQMAIRSKIEYENPGWTIVGFCALTDGGEEYP